MEKPPQKSTGRDVAERIIEGATGAIPIVGGPLAVAFKAAMGWSFDRRMEGWLNDLATAVSELQEGSLSFEDLAEDDRFVDAVIAGSRAAQATHSSEKLAALRNGVLNSINIDELRAEEHLRFFRLVDQMTPGHLRLLAYLSDPGGAVDAAGLKREAFEDGSVSPAGVLEKVYEDFSGRREWLGLLNDDLITAHLVYDGIYPVPSQTRSIQQTLWAPTITMLGKKFLAFVRQPRLLPADTAS